MACKTSFEFYHNFPKLAEEAGFAFNIHKPRVHVNWNKIRLIDLERLVKDRKFVIIEQHVNDILDCVLESEFDVRILDEGVVKLFRLAQLTLEYQQFCRYYLDKSVHVLRDELSTLMEQLDSARKDIKDKEEELKRLKRKSKHIFRPTFSGNENIANMILKTLSNNGEMFPSTSFGNSSHEYNKCGYCEKVFLNQLYLKSHLARRHSNVTDIPQRDEHNPIQEPNKNEENIRLHNEVSELKCKLQEMEIFMKNINNKTGDEISPEDVVNVSIPPSEPNENVILEKIEEWKKEEHVKYSNEIDNLRSQITDTINNLRIKEKNDEIHDFKSKENELVKQLHKTIQDQGAELLALKQEIINKKLNEDQNKTEQTTQLETQMQIWIKKMQQQAESYEKMISDLNMEAKKAHKARMLAEAQVSDYRNMSVQTLSSPKIKTSTDTEVQAKKMTRPKILSDKKLEELHQKAQKLLNLGNSSSSEESLLEPDINRSNFKITSSSDKKQKVDEIIPKKHVSDKPHGLGYKDTKPKKLKETIKTEKKKLQNNNKKGAEPTKENLNNNISGQTRSPIKVVRAKIMEEVSSKLAHLGVDPLRRELDFKAFSKQRSRLQQEQIIKLQNKPSYERIRNSIIAYLDSKAGMEQDFQSDTLNNSSKNKAFSLTSMLSNVKNRAVSLVKHSEHIDSRQNFQTKDIAKKASPPLRTPPSSEQTSPNPRRSSSESASSRQGTLTKLNENKKSMIFRRQKSLKGDDVSNFSDNSVTETSESNSNEDTKNDDLLKSVENLIKSPIKRPSTANGNYNKSRFDIPTESKETGLLKAHSASNLNQHNITVDSINLDSDALGIRNVTSPIKKTLSENNIHDSPIQTKSVLKSALSTSSLNKKKVLFDLDAIQMKSVSASPSQSTERSEANEKYELGLVNLEDEEWDISSIENDLKINEDLKLNLSSRTTKVSELKQSIESQLARRTVTPSTMLVGIDLLGGPSGKASTGGSNTSLGSSVLDTDDLESDVHKKSRSITKPKQIKDVSEFDLSDISLDDEQHKSKRDSF